jgi:site-specific DNA-methyltransferase (adenine-specific)
MVCAIEDAGFEIRDQLAWIYGSGFPKSHNQPGGWGTALKPAWEPICLARKPLIGTVAATIALHGTGAINIDGCRIEGVKPQVTQGVNTSATSFNVTRERRLSGDPNEGRWPANIIHDGSEEVLAGFPESVSTGGQASLGAFRNGDIYGKGKDIREARDPGFGDSGSAARFFYCAKATSDERGEGNNHPTVKPVDLMRWLVRLVTPKGGLVLDPFAGSGSTLIAADREQFHAIGCELSEEYAAIARRRLDTDRGPLFSESAAA